MNSKPERPGGSSEWTGSTQSAPAAPGRAGLPSQVGAVASTDPLADLLKQSSHGDEAAFARLYDATSARAFGLAVRVVRDRAQAEEVTQEAYLEVWRTASRYDEALGSALTWVLTMVHRRAVDRVRSAESSSRREVVYETTHASTAHDSTAETVEASLEARRVRTALGTLTPVQRQAVELAFLGGYTHTEVAAMLDLPVGTAKTRIRDGLIRMRDAMGVGQ